MATATGKARCITCDKDKSADQCLGCSQLFCYTHLQDHHQQLAKQLDEIEVDRDIFRQTLTQQALDTKQNSLIKQIDGWEESSIQTIQQIAEESRKLVHQHTTEYIKQIEMNLNKLTEELRQSREEDDFNEIILNEFKEKLAQLTTQLDQPSNISIKQDPSSPIKRIRVVVPSDKRPSKSIVQDQVNDLDEQYVDNETLQNEIKLLRIELNEKKIDEQAYLAVKSSLHELEKRCVKHQKGETETKKQLVVYQNLINDLQRENQDLTERLTSSAEEYNILFGKYAEFERSIKSNQHNEELDTRTSAFNHNTTEEEDLVSLLRRTARNQSDGENSASSIRPSSINIDTEVGQCPLCHWQFPAHLTVDAKQEHIEHHFQ